MGIFLSGSHFAYLKSSLLVEAIHRSNLIEAVPVSGSNLDLFFLVEVVPF